MEETQLFKITVSFGSLGSSISLPCYMSHASIPAAVRAARGLPDHLVRISVGVEHPDDLLAGSPHYPEHSLMLSCFARVIALMLTRLVFNGSTWQLHCKEELVACTQPVLCHAVLHQHCSLLCSSVNLRITCWRACVSIVRTSVYAGCCWVKFHEGMHQDINKMA